MLRVPNSERRVAIHSVDRNATVRERACGIAEAALSFKFLIPGSKSEFHDRNKGCCSASLFESSSLNFEPGTRNLELNDDRVSAASQA
ncbi:MAG: hypothetical protein DWQ47_01340 [Acidobacteria bacterium]|nr:MAG: hypothetical protein DWQ32_11800 [Acidobacteriota bacterium]REK04144.1 MAG: hypothetical protein DWQ38_01325 [Acidobacteriota bacterium]REK15306.1 MAG: hypothetical protein DWQ43_17490 [Acidobacteriota bacterium]REK46396.1 MAG: hypothetical protein DWQ47_01340 [Acidobacteriota bacterium]